jgi:hypothetical protein
MNKLWINQKGKRGKWILYYGERFPEEYLE